MNQKKFSKLITSLRKKHNLTQQELADKLSITPKAISKWECGMGLPDITMLKEISKIFNITTDELLNGELKEDKQKKFPYYLIIIIIILIIVIFLIAKQKSTKEEIKNCTVTRTYYIDNIDKSNDENYLYITIHEFQTEGTFTIKISKIIGNNLEINSNYEFTFLTTDKYLNTTTDDLFNHSEVINVNKTDKIGNEQVSTSYCNK